MTPRQELKAKITKHLKDDGYEPNEFGQVVIIAQDGNMINLNLTILNFLDDHYNETL